MDLLVREVELNDAEAIVSILNPIIEAGVYTAFDTPLTVEAEREYILHFPVRGVFHVALCYHEQKVVGFQSMEPFANYTHAFDHVGVVGTYVDLSYRCQKVATSLFNATFELARQRGYEKLLTYIRADNMAALATYQNQSFEIIGIAKRQAKINSRYIDEIIVEKFL